MLDGSRFAQLDELLSKTDLYTKFLRLVCSSGPTLVGCLAKLPDSVTRPSKGPLCGLRSEQMSAIEARTDTEAGEAGTCRKRKANGKAGGARKKGPGAAAISTHVRISTFPVRPDYVCVKRLIVWIPQLSDFFHLLTKSC